MRRFTLCILLLFSFTLFINDLLATGGSGGNGELCFVNYKKPNTVYAKVTWTYNSSDQTYTIRTTLAKTFVDNTYGSNAIGWSNGHKFGDLVGSDNLQMALYDNHNNKKLEFRIDYLSAYKHNASGYKTLGVTGGDGKMLVGSSSNIVSVKTSLDENFNTYGYALKTNSPATNSNYAVNSSYPNWIYDVWYEVKVKASAFGSSGFKVPYITCIHASPSKTGSKTEYLVPGPCPGEMTLGNLVWNDLNNDGIKQSNEPGISGLVVKLYRDDNATNIPDGSAIASTTTDANGFYYFSNLTDGKYIVGVTKAHGFSQSASVSSSDNPNNNIDNDNNGIIDAGGEIRTKYITLTKNSEPTNDGDGSNGNLTLDIGLVKVTLPPTGGEICFASPTKPQVSARIQYNTHPSNDQLTIRVILSKSFVDNTYGSNTIGWPGNNHKFSHLVGSDNLELALYDANNNKKLQFKMDYISSSKTVASGYRSLGVLGGDGKMVYGSSSNILSVKTSLDANFNDFGYVLTTNSPATDNNYTPNPAYSNWIYDVWYEVTVKLSALGSSGLGKIVIPSLHASPSKTGKDSEPIVEVPCTPVLKLGDLVFRDNNNNGLADSGEPGIGGATVKLYKDVNDDNTPDGAAIATTTTNSSGKYSFSNLEAGKYIVGVVIPSGYQAANTTSTSSDPDNNLNNDNNGVRTVNGELRSNNITLSVNGEPTNDGDGNDGNLTLDFGLKTVPVNNLNLGDLVWNDLNGNGLRDSGEPGMANVRVRLYKDNNSDNTPDGEAIDSTLTNSNGIYSFTNLAEGRYIVGAVIPANFQATVTISSSLNPDNNINNDNNGILTIVEANEVQTRAITLTANSEPTNDGDGANGNLTLDIGFEVCGNLILGDYVWDDTNGDGLQDADEFGIYDVKVTLVMPNGSTQVTYTDPDGYYYFLNLVPGTYKVQFETPAGYQPTIANAGADDRDSDPVGGEVTVVLTNTPPGNLTIDAGFIPVSLNLGNLVFHDVNHNGMWDSGEPGIPGIMVTLYKDDDTDNVADGLAIDTTMTDANGYYQFTGLEAGHYIVSIHVDMNVWVNGPIPFTGTDPNNNVDHDNNGVYTFDHEIFSSNITLTGGGEPTNDGDGPDGNLTLDFGLIPCPPPAFAINLGNRIWLDTNSNGIFDQNEQGIPNLLVKLYEDQNQDNIPDGPAIDTTYTSNDGSYGFSNVDNGSYIVGVEAASAGFSKGATIGTSTNPDNDIDDDNNGVNVVNGEVRSNFITLLAGTEPTNDGDGSNGNLTLDFGLFGNGFIGDFVWDDLNGNGLQDAGEPGLRNVRIKLTLPNGDSLITFSNANGQYGFSNLAPGTYTITFNTPPYYNPTFPNVGFNDEIDSDPVNGSVTIVLAPNEVNDDMDAGFIDDIDDDDDGIIDIVEGKGYDGLKDCDGDGIPNYMDPTPGCTTPTGTDVYGRPYEPLTWKDCPRPGFPSGDGINDWFDFDQDGIIDQLDLDSDNDGILDAHETRDPRMVDANRDGIVDGGDDDRDGLRNSADATPTVYGGPGLLPQDLDRDGLPNYTDLDSDGDGLSDLTEAREAWDADGMADGIDSDGDGVNDIYDQIPGHGARGIDVEDRDGDGKPNPYDIDSDNDGITDNVEGQPTCSYKEPSGTDADKDGLDDAYDMHIGTCPPRGGGITPYDKDGDGTPDIYDLDTDNDGAPDVNEGSGIPGNFVTNFGDTDNDGLIDQFDIWNNLTAVSQFWRNVVHSNMGANGTFDGPVPAGSNAQLPQKVSGNCATGADRDWRNITILPVTLLNFSGNHHIHTVDLRWQVTNEDAIAHYEIERSIDGVNFETIGKVVAIGNRPGVFSYNYKDNVINFTTGNLYYRLRQVDKSGFNKLSNTLVFKLGSNRSAEVVMAVHPNPARDHFMLKFVSPKQGLAHIRILDISGKIMLNKNEQMATGTNAIHFNNFKPLSSGTYIIQVIMDGEIYHDKLVISR